MCLRCMGGASTLYKSVCVFAKGLHIVSGEMVNLKYDGDREY